MKTIGEIVYPFQHNARNLGAALRILQKILPREGPSYDKRLEFKVKDPLETHREVTRHILSVLCDTKSYGRSPETMTRLQRLQTQFGLGSSHSLPERVTETPVDDAFKRLADIHKHRLPKSLNPFHKTCKVLAMPKLIVDADSVRVSAVVACPEDFGVHGYPSSYWECEGITDQPNPRWRPGKEAFADFLDRAANHFKQLTPRSDGVAGEGRSPAQQRSILDVKAPAADSRKLGKQSSAGLRP